MRKRAATFVGLALPLGFAARFLRQFDGPLLDAARDTIQQTIGALPDSARLVLIGAVLMALTSALRAATSPSSERRARSQVRVPPRSVPMAHPSAPRQDATA